MIDFLLMKRIWRRQYILWESIWVCRCPKHFISICFTFLTVLVFVLKPSVFKIALCVVFNSRPSDEEEVKRWARYRNTKTTQTCLMRGMFTILAEATAANGTKRWKKNDNYTDSELILHNFHNWLHLKHWRACRFCFQKFFQTWYELNFSL